MFCCGGVEEENFGAPSNQYTAPPRGNTYGGKWSFSSAFEFFWFLPCSVVARNLFVEMLCLMEGRNSVGFCCLFS